MTNPLAPRRRDTLAGLASALALGGCIPAFPLPAPSPLFFRVTLY